MMGATRTPRWYTYVLHDADGTVLYVGSCTNLSGRIARHQLIQPWGDQIVDIRAAIHANRPESLLAERELRETLRPLYARDAGYEPSEQARRALGRGELVRLAIDCLTERGPMTAAQVDEAMRDHGFAGAKSSAGAVLWRMLHQGVVEIVDEVPASTPGRWKTARVYALVENAESAAA